MSPHRHERFGWGMLAVFAMLGLTLEVLHGLRVSSYLDEEHSTRRLLWTLAHAHGMLLGLVNVAFAVAVRGRPRWNGRSRAVASASLRASSVLLPVGFFLGGAWLVGDDPNPLVALSVAGGVLFVIAAVLTWRAMGASE